MKMLWAALAACLVALGAVAAELEGAFKGLDAAEGMRIELDRRGGGWSGTMVDASGETRRLSLSADGESARGDVDFGAFTALMVLRPAPVGLQAAIIPYSDGGDLLAGELRLLPFVPEGVDLPPEPDRYRDPPTAPARATPPRGFVSSYPFWPPLAVAYAYEGLPTRFRTLIRLFPLVHTDLLWKLCESPERTPGVAAALRGQGVTCRDVAQGVRGAMADGRFLDFKRDVERERDILVRAIVCADDLRTGDPECEAAGAETARRALSMETASTVLRRY